MVQQILLLQQLSLMDQQLHGGTRVPTHQVAGRDLAIQHCLQAQQWTVTQKLQFLNHWDHVLLLQDLKHPL